LELTRYAEEAGCDGVVVIPPNFWWIKIADEDIVFDHFKRIAGEISAPLIVYDNGYGISLHLLGRLSKIDNIRALKDSSNDFMKLAAKIAQFKDRIAIFPGEEQLLLPSLVLGASGGICSGFNIYPKLMLKMYSEFRAGRFKEALAIHEGLVPLWNAVYAHDEHHTVKESLALMGMPIGSPRPPYLGPPLSGQDRGELRRLLESAGLLPSTREKGANQ
jgi:4-hydroxy-tetrahydrodipicolinate synthase